MSLVGSSSYLPTIEQEGGGGGSERKERMRSTGHDPLYAAMMGGNIGSALGGVAQVELERDTLDEPVLVTLKRDLNMVKDKTWLILTLSDASLSLKEWDLWGPLINSLVLAVCLGMASITTVSAFTLTFALIWVGALATTANARLLGYRLALLPAIAFLGYSLAPLAMATLSLVLIPSFWLLRSLIVVAGAGWTMTAALRLLEMDPALEDRRLLAAFPLCLYICLISWLVIII